MKIQRRDFILIVAYFIGFLPFMPYILGNGILKRAKQLDLVIYPGRLKSFDYNEMRKISKWAG